MAVTWKGNLTKHFTLEEYTVGNAKSAKIAALRGRLRALRKIYTEAYNKRLDKIAAGKAIAEDGDQGEEEPYGTAHD